MLSFVYCLLVFVACCNLMLLVVIQTVRCVLCVAVVACVRIGS